MDYKKKPNTVKMIVVDCDLMHENNQGKGFVGYGEKGEVLSQYE